LLSSWSILVLYIALELRPGHYGPFAVTGEAQPPGLATRN